MSNKDIINKHKSEINALFSKLNKDNNKPIYTYNLDLDICNQPFVSTGWSRDEWKEYERLIQELENRMKIEIETTIESYLDI